MQNIDLDKIKFFIEQNEKKVKMVTVIIAIAIIILFFWIKGNENEVIIENQDNITETEISNEDGEVPADTTESAPEYLYVDISGEVQHPGVYKVANGTRLFEVIDMAGGLTDEADPNTLNRAEAVYDGQKVIVMAAGSTLNYEEYLGNDNSGVSSDGKVNINTADKDTLKTLPGIGDVKAQAIISYRQNSGSFGSIEDLKNVNGIGDSTFSIIMDMITV